MYRLTLAVLCAFLIIAFIVDLPNLSGSIHSQGNTAPSSQATIQIPVEHRMGQEVVVLALYLSADSDRNWGPNRLGHDVMRPGTMLHTDIQGDCIQQDVRILVLHEGIRRIGSAGEIIRRGLDVCTGLRLTPDFAWRIEPPT